MSAFLTALTSVANQYGDAGNSAREEKQARADKMHSFDIQEAQLQLEQQAGARAEQEMQQRIRAGKYLDFNLPPSFEGGIRYKTFYDTEQGKFAKVPIGKFNADPLGGLKQVMSMFPKDQQSLIQHEYESELGTTGDPEKALGKANDLVNKFAERKITQDAEEKRAKESRDFQHQEHEDTREFQRQEREIRRQERLEDRKLLMDYAKGLSAMKPTADEIRRADLAENVNENLDALEEIVKRRGDLFGPMKGTLTTIRGKIGTGDEDIAALEQIRDNLGRALQGAHGMRSATGVVSAGNSVLNSFRNNDKAVLSAINRARSSVQTFISDVQRKAGAGAGGADPNNPLGLP